MPELLFVGLLVLAVVARRVGRARRGDAIGPRAQLMSEFPEMLGIPSDLPAPLIPLAWLIGSWAGAGVGDYPTIEPFRFGQEMTFSYLPGKPYLMYESRSFLLDGAGEIGDPLATESGYWRPQPDREVEVVIAHPTGIAELWIGEIVERRVELRTDAVVRTPPRSRTRPGTASTATSTAATWGSCSRWRPWASRSSRTCPPS